MFIDNEIKKTYFDWLISNISFDCFQYSKLLTILINVDFEPIVDDDNNRYEEGLYLRKRFAQDFNFNDTLCNALVNDSPCSILEMMIALVYRMELIMANDEYGDRTHLWFSQMLTSLNIKQQTNGVINEVFVHNILNKLNSRNYCKNGYGGLFTIRDVDDRYDMRKYGIWDQMNLYINQIDKDSEHINL